MPPKNKKTEKEFDYKTIKTFEDACKKENIDPEKLPDVFMIPESFRKAIINCYKLFIIFKAINNGWIPDWNNSNQFKYYPWFKVLSSGSGFDFSNSHSYYAGTATAVGSRLCTDTSEKAIYIGKQFGDEYAEFFLISE
jgi:hypothetical protein